MRNILGTGLQPTCFQLRYLTLLGTLFAEHASLFLRQLEQWPFLQCKHCIWDRRITCKRFSTAKGDARDRILQATEYICYQVVAEQIFWMDESQELVPTSGSVFK